MLLTVIVPSYKRPRELLRCLSSLQEQEHSEYEVIIVDNDPEENLKRTVEGFHSASGLRFKYTAEPRLGLHNARHRGARLSNGKILVFTDDDATFDPGWLDAYSKAFAKHPGMVAAGGPVRPVWEATPPNWLRKFMGPAKMFPILSLMEPYKEFRLDTQGFFFGVNMAIRRKVLFEVGGFNPELIGSVTVGDGESGLNRKLRERGYLIGYVPEAVVHHHIPPDRMTVDYIQKWSQHLGGAVMYRKLHGRPPSHLRLICEAIRVLATKWPWWLSFSLVRNRRDRLSLNFRLRANEAWHEMKYLWQCYNNPQFRQYLVQRDFLHENDGPERVR